MTQKPRKFAEGTGVPIDRSRGEIERLLKRHKATGFFYGDQGNRAMIGFELGGRRYHMDLPYPVLESYRYMQAGAAPLRERTDDQMEAAQEKEKQRLWRGLLLLVKAKLEAIADGITTLEMELQPYTVMPNGQRVGEWLEPQIEQAYQTKRMPPLLPDARSPQRTIESDGGK
jgi:hypothetical protein